MSKILDYDTVNEFVEKQRKGTVFWDGWSLVFFHKTPNGYSSKRGAFRNGFWGMQTRVDVGSDGKWVIPPYVRVS